MESADPGARLGLFAGWGVELEYMIVDRETLDVRPLCDELLRRAAGGPAADFDDGPIGWSNELVLHVVELKTGGPAARLEGLAAAFQESLARVEALLEPLGARLLPGGMHPWMDPQRETRLWPYENDVVYATFDRIFDCRGHGWSNLQSAHLNLSFGEDEREDGEFARLHAAIRVVLPLLPALAASSPVVEGRPTGLCDTRLEVYRKNSQRVPSVAGRVIPEGVSTQSVYRREILERIYRDMAPHDPEGVLRHEWCNARGAIARFDRSAIEIRVLDVQECPRADLAIAALCGAAIRALVEERWAPLERLAAVELEPLAELFVRCAAQAERTPVEDPAYLELFGLSGGPRSAGEVWSHLRERLLAGEALREHGPALATILDEGPLARRLLAALGPGPSRARLRDVYGELADCLRAGRLFHAR